MTACYGSEREIYNERETGERGKRDQQRDVRNRRRMDIDMRSAAVFVGVWQSVQVCR